jgi:hypothetical protein
MKKILEKLYEFGRKLEELQYSGDCSQEDLERINFLYKELVKTVETSSVTSVDDYCSLYEEVERIKKITKSQQIVSVCTDCIEIIYMLWQVLKSLL